MFLKAVLTHKIHNDTEPEINSATSLYFYQTNSKQNTCLVFKVFVYYF